MKGKGEYKLRNDLWNSIPMMAMLTWRIGDILTSLFFFLLRSSNKSGSNQKSRKLWRRSLFDGSRGHENVAKGAGGWLSIAGTPLVCLP